MTTVIAIGATSAMVFETMRQYAADTTTTCIFLCGRDAQKLTVLKDDLTVRGSHKNIQVHAIVDSLSDEVSAKNILGQVTTIISKHSGLSSELAPVETVLIGYGTLPDQEQALIQPTIVKDTVRVNLTSTIDHSLIWFNYFEQERAKNNRLNYHPTLAVISSVAGDRGRRANFLYGATKAGLSAFLSGLRSYGTSKKIAVITLKPGFVDSAMTAHIKKGPLFASAQIAGKAIHRAIVKKSDISYIPFFWRYIMLIVRVIPEIIFKRLPL